MVYFLKKGQLQYKWDNVVPGFQMPVDMLLGDGKSIRIYPADSWKSIPAKNLKTPDLKADTVNFYVKQRQEQQE